MISAPALAKSATYLSGSTIIRCTSNGLVVTGRRASTIKGPIVMLGTKRPSITSTWIQSAPAASTARTSSPSREKSAERIEGEITRGLVLMMAAGLQVARLYGLVAPCSLIRWLRSGTGRSCSCQGPERIRRPLAPLHQGTTDRASNQSPSRLVRPAPLPTNQPPDRCGSHSHPGNS